MLDFPSAYSVVLISFLSSVRLVLSTQMSLFRISSLVIIPLQILTLSSNNRWSSLNTLFTNHCQRPVPSLEPFVNMLSGNALMEIERLCEEVRQETSIVQVYIKMARIKEIKDVSNAEDFSNDLHNFIGGGNDVSQEGPLSSDLSM
jgi:hypothetical protein